MDLFAGVAVSDYDRAVPWYERLLGRPPSFLPNDVEAVWELAPHRFVFLLADPDRAGGALVTGFVEDLDALVSAVRGRGLEPERWEEYDNGVRKAIYLDPDGNEVNVAGAGG